MGTADLLQHVRAVGFTLDAAGGKLLVTPASMLTDDLRDALRASKPELLALLLAPGLADRHHEVVVEIEGDDLADHHDVIVDQVHHPVVGGACTDCLHLLARGTCGGPVAAGLLESFGIVWPPEGHGARCAGYSGKTPAKAPARPYKLTKDGADAARAEPWGDAAIARFQSRVHRFTGLGLIEQDADNLAERLHLRDLDDDDRNACFECASYRPGRCGNHHAAGLTTADISAQLAALLQRCPGYSS